MADTDLERSSDVQGAPVQAATVDWKDHAGAVRRKGHRIHHCPDAVQVIPLAAALMVGRGILDEHDRNDLGATIHCRNQDIARDAR